MASPDASPRESDAPTFYRLRLSFRSPNDDPAIVLQALLGEGGRVNISAADSPQGLKLPSDLVIDSYRLTPCGDHRYELELQTLGFDDWLENRRREARTWVIDGDLVVQPSWVHGELQGKAVVRLDPGIAFGTGGHISTRLALLGLKTHMPPHSDVLDVGCGTGVLSISAALLGAAHVVAVDVDPVARALTRSNAVRNGVADRIRVLPADHAGWKERTFDVVVANLTRELLSDNASSIAACTADDGVAVCSGLRTVEADGIGNLFSDLEMPWTGRFTAGEWSALVVAHA